MAIATGNKLMDGYLQNANTPSIVHYIQQNLYAFASAKSYEELRLLRDFLSKGGSNISYAQFRNKALATEMLFNDTYLNVEYHNVIANALIAQQWDSITNGGENNALITFKTIGDGRVRPEHAMLNNITQPANSPFWRYNTPPLGWNCRCYIILSNGKNTNIKAYTDSQAKTLARQNKTPIYFQKNPFLDKVIFGNEHPYFNKLHAELKFDKSYNLPTAQKINDTLQLPKLEENKEWFNQQKKDITIKGFDKLEYNLSVNLKDKSKGLGHIKNEPDRISIAHLIPEIISKPDEVYLTKGIKNKGTVDKSFIKYYENQPVVVFTNDDKVITIFKADNFKKCDDFRKGVLIKKISH